MSCNHPLKAFWTGNLTDKGEKEYFIAPSTAGDIVSFEEVYKKHFKVGFAAPTLDVNGHSYLKDPVPIPCGHCVGCRLDNSRMWKIRCCLEALNWDTVHFITLTYDDEHLPLDENGELVLSKRDLELFWKRLRKKGYNFKFFSCGEYGTSTHGTHRPHYHAIIFGSPFSDLVPVLRNRFQSAELNRIWGKGLTDLQIADPGSIAYVCGYVEKKQLDPEYFDYSVKPFRSMSRGLGKDYIDGHLGSLLSTGKVYGNFGSSHEATLPRYLKLKLKERFPDWYKAHTAAGVFSAKESRLVDQSVFGSLSEEDIGDTKDIHLINSLQKVRKVKL